MMFLAFVMFSVFIVGLAQGRVLPTPLKSEEGEEELSGVTVVARDENVDDDRSSSDDIFVVSDFSRRRL